MQLSAEPLRTGKSLRVLIVEDSENDAMLLVRELRHEGYEVIYDCVKGAAAFTTALDKGQWDVVISDYHMPQFSALAALKLLQEKELDIPFLILSGFVGEEMAVEALKAGASDFFLKDRLGRLFPAIERELREAAARRKRKEIEQQLYDVANENVRLYQAAQEQRERLRVTLASIGDAVIATDMQEQITFMNAVAQALTGWQEEEAIGTPLHRVFVTTNAPSQTSPALRVLQERTNLGLAAQTYLVALNGKQIPIENSGSPILDEKGAMIGYILVFRDITQRKQSELAELEQRILAEALRDTAIALNSSLNLSQVLEQILINAERVIMHDSAHIMLIENGIASVVRSQVYAERYLADFEADLSQRKIPVAKQAALQMMIESRRPIVISDTHDAATRVEDLVSPSVRSYIGVPIVIGAAVIGFLNLHSLIPGFFTEQHLERLEAFAAQAAVAIQNAQVHQQERELAALEERQRLARDLHDAVSQMLFSSSIIAEALPRLAQDKPDKIGLQLERLKRLNRGALAEMRNLLLELRSNHFEGMEISELLHQLAQATMGHTQLSIRVQIEGKPLLPPEVQMTFYRIAQEALNNIMKHARASEVEILLTEAGDKVTLCIKDNGRGFTHQPDSPTHMGLSIMGERARSIGATCEINSAAGKGTEVLVTWVKGAVGAAV